MAKFRIAIETNHRLGERFWATRFHEDSVPNYFRNCGRACRYNRLAGSHCLQKYDAEALLNARQTEDLCALVLRSQPGKGHVTEPPYDWFEAQFKAEPAKSLRFRPVSYDPKFEFWNRSTKERGGPKKDVQAFARIKPAHG
jgi:hypothetical protein